MEFCFIRIMFECVRTLFRAINNAGFVLKAASDFYLFTKPNAKVFGGTKFNNNDEVMSRGRILL